MGEVTDLSEHRQDDAGADLEAPIDEVWGELFGIMGGDFISDFNNARARDVLWTIFERKLSVSQLLAVEAALSEVAERERIYMAPAAPATYVSPTEAEG